MLITLTTVKYIETYQLVRQPRGKSGLIEKIESKIIEKSNTTFVEFLTNKNRLCSKTCGVDIGIEYKKDQAKIE